MNEHAKPLTEQKPCPFCGHRATNASNVMNRDLWWISCTHCEAEMSAGTKELVVEAWNRRAALASQQQAEPPVAQAEPFQSRVQPWMLACFGHVISANKTERNHRFLEEALELVQACDGTASEAHQLVDYVFGRPVGEPSQEVGGVMVTLAALCLAQGLDMHAAAETELARIWTKVEAIRAKQAAKPKHSPLPAAPPPAATPPVAEPPSTTL
jgi:Lar family restriction alleviation protein